jgi:methionyl aminopeptidase
MIGIQMIDRNDLCWCGSGKKWKKCHYPVDSPGSKSSFQEIYLKQYKILLKSEKQIEGIKRACKLAAHILDELCKKAREGVTTNEIDLLCQKLHKESGAIAAPLGYGTPPYPKSVCTSINDVICHGIPNDLPLNEGDILNIDVTSILNGFYGDCSRMVMIGEVSEEKKRVVDVSYDCLMESIKICRPGTKIYEIGEVIEKIAHEHNCSVVDQFVGHGVGLYFHEPPQIPHHHNNIQIPLAPGMTFTIEPMINAGFKTAVIDSDQWTARTKDGKPSAQWEHTILITDGGFEILTNLNIPTVTEKSAF